MLWVDASCSRRDVLGWLLFMITKYPLFQLNALLDISTAILQSSSEHTQQRFVHAVYALMETAD